MYGGLAITRSTVPSSSGTRVAMSPTCSETSVSARLRTAQRRRVLGDLDRVDLTPGDLVRPALGDGPRPGAELDHHR